MTPISLKILYLILQIIFKLLKYSKYPIITLFLCLNISLAQQKTFVLKDKATQQPIGLVAVATQKGNGVYSNESGTFNFSISPKDTLFISHLSYQKLVLVKKDLDNLTASTIFLTPIITELSEIKVKPKKLTKRMLGYYKEETASGRPGPGGNTDFNVFVNHIKNISKTEGFIEKLYFDLSVKFLWEKGQSKARIRVFSVGSDGLPKDDILNKEIIKNIDKLTPNINVNISDLKIIFPPEGVFIGLEFFCHTNITESKKKGYINIDSNCPHVATAKVTNQEEIGNSFFWSKTKSEKLRWVCYSNGVDYKAFKGQVFKFGAEVSQ